MLCPYFNNFKFLIQCINYKMTEITNISSKSKHNRLLKNKRLERLEEKMKKNIKKRKKIIKK